MSPADFAFLCEFLLKHSGLALTESKRYLVESRLVPLAMSSNLKDVSELVRELRTGRNSVLTTAVIEEMTTNETSFFRDLNPFEELRLRLLTKLLDARRTRHTLRIWSAASSTGQEAYSIAMTLLEAIPDIRQWRIEIVATDIAEKILVRAREGVYSQLEVQRGLPASLLVKYFDNHPKGFQVKADLRRMVSFQKLNLLEPFARLGMFDIVFCRNVLIYFDVASKADLLNRIARQLTPDGYLFLGAAETVLGLNTPFERCQTSKGAVYALASKPTPKPHICGAEFVTPTLK